MGLVSDLRILYRLTCTRVGGASHQDRLEAFYRHQASGYDDFRKRLLHGRAVEFALYHAQVVRHAQNTKVNLFHAFPILAIHKALSVLTKVAAPLLCSDTNRQLPHPPQIYSASFSNPLYNPATCSP